MATLQLDENLIIRMASKEGLGRGEDIYMDPALPRFSDSRVLAHLEQHLFRYPEIPFEEKKSGETSESLEVFAASSPQEEVRLIWGTYHLLQMSDQFKSDPDQFVTNLQCRLISDLLILFEWLEPTEDDGQKIKQRIHHYLKNFDSLDELITATQYKQSPNKKSSMDYY